MVVAYNIRAIKPEHPRDVSPPYMTDTDGLLFIYNIGT